MATVTLYEYDGETRTESRVAVNWNQLGEPVEFDSSEMNFEEALGDAFPPDMVRWFQSWGTAQRVSKKIKAYEAESPALPGRSEGVRHVEY